MFFDQNFMALRTAVARRYANSIFHNLSDNELSTISPALKDVELSKDTRLFASGTAAANIYFPIDSVISFIGDTGGGGSIEVWAVGGDGMAGMSALLGG